MRVSISPHLHQSFVIVCLFTLAALMGVEWHLLLVSICISLKASDIEHLSMCLLADCVYAEEMSVQAVCSFYLWVICLSRYKIFISYMICKNILPFYGSSSHFLVSLGTQKF